MPAMLARNRADADIISRARRAGNICVDRTYVDGSYMTTGFVGRRSELALLRKRLARVAASGAIR
ncbi:MAG: hypothetical protein ACRDNZ_00065 [Streptosporangiaceae bacterium]